MKLHNKVVASVLTMSVLGGLMVVPYSVFANPSIPETMEPGTIVTYDKNNEMIVHKYQFNDSVKRTSLVKENKQNQNQKLLEEETAIFEKVKKDAESLPVFYLDEPVLPKPEPGMTIYYDGMGLPTKIIDAKGNLVDTESKAAASWTPPKNGVYIYGKDDNKLTITDKYVQGEGWVSWYDGMGEKGSDGKKLKKDNCATKMKYDRPTFNKEIKVRNLKNDIVDYVYKADVGGLPNAVLDIMPEKMEDDFDSPVDRKKNTGRFEGRTFYEK
ncbi:hypothetical protein EEL30_00265 (plasmid) [Brevibacillus laterosporus]|uniref:Uncharacterized protein n=1 Tax=Brevibacillus laterosporus TaxID=1465 RepID=A0A518V1T2_BRELA|nr:hypothetical protein EEL30_00265 [Brevibacillus laterosporus]